MSNLDESRLPSELEDAARQIQAARRQPTADELERLKPRVPRTAASSASRGGTFRQRVVTVGLTLALIAGGGGAVIAASGGGAERTVAPGATSAAKKEYCPPNSPGAGRPKPPGGNCGNGQGGTQGNQGNGNNGNKGNNDQGGEVTDKTPSKGNGNDAVGGLVNSRGARGNGSVSGSTSTTDPNGSQLPFTGFGLLALLVAGVLLTTTGTAGRRRLRKGR